MDNQIAKSLFDEEGYLTQEGQSLDQKYKSQVRELVQPLIAGGYPWHEIVAVLSGTAELEVRRQHIKNRKLSEEKLDKPLFMQK